MLVCMKHDPIAMSCRANGTLLQCVTPVGLRRMGPKGQALWTNALCTTLSLGLQNPGSPEQSPAGSTRLQQLTVSRDAHTAGHDEQPPHRNDARRGSWHCDPCVGPPPLCSASECAGMHCWQGLDD